MGGKPEHDYHLVNPSIWPAYMSFAMLALVVGGLLYMHDKPGWHIVMPLAFAGILYGCFGWWRDVIREGMHDHAHTPVVRRGLRFGMALFIVSEVMFFVCFFWAFFSGVLLHWAPLEDIWPTKEGIWPPEGIVTFDPWHLPFMNTLILLLSGTTVTWAHHALLEGDRKGLIQGLTLTVMLGALFTVLQAYEYSHAAFGFTDGLYASTFYMATGFHGAHVLIGTIFLLVCLFRAKKGHFTPEHHLGFEFAAWYWHFVDVVWLFLFIVVYIWGS